MSDIYEANAPVDFPNPKEQPLLEEELSGHGIFKTPPVRESIDRWRKDVLDKIQYLRENLDQVLQEKEALTQEGDRLQEELTRARERVRELEVLLSETLDTFNALLNEVSQALED